MGRGKENDHFMNMYCVLGTGLSLLYIISFSLYSSLLRQAKQDLFPSHLPGKKKLREVE